MNFLLISFSNSNSNNFTYDYKKILENQNKLEAITNDLKFTDKKVIRKSIRSFFDNVETNKDKLTNNNKTEIKELIKLLGFNLSNVETKYNIKLTATKVKTNKVS